MNEQGGFKRQQYKAPCVGIKFLSTLLIGITNQDTAL